jgi:hypothetical protein
MDGNFTNTTIEKVRFYYLKELYQKYILNRNRTQLTLQLDDPLKRSGKVPLAR